MRCRHEVERNGYYTGRRCSRDATVLISRTSTEGDTIPCCTQHANLVRKRWQYRAGAPLPPVDTPIT